MMTDEELKEIRDRAEKATPGPLLGLYLSGDTINGVKNAAGAVGLGEVGLTAADHKFITHARDDIPALLADVERLRAQNVALREIVQAVATADLQRVSLADAQRLILKARALLASEEK